MKKVKHSTEYGLRVNNSEVRLKPKEYVTIPCYKCGKAFQYCGDACWQVTCPNCHHSLDAPKLRKMGVDI